MTNWKRISFMIMVMGLFIAWTYSSAFADPLDDAMAAIDRKDYESAVKLLQPLAEQGNAEAQFNIGEIYLQGLGVNEDAATAMKWLYKAADQGHAAAQFQIGERHITGESGITRDSAEAAKWFRKAADQGNVQAQSFLGVLYWSGNGVTEDLVQAYKWDSLAAAGGEEESIGRLDEEAKKMTPEQLAEAKRLVSEWKPTPVPSKQ